MGLLLKAFLRLPKFTPIRKYCGLNNWYSRHTGPFGGEYYYKLHFTLHSVYEYSRKVGSRYWYRQDFVNDNYFIRPANVKGAYTFGPQGEANLLKVETVRPRHFVLSNHKRYWGLEYFDHTDHQGGIDKTPPFRTWCYFTKMKYVTGDWGSQVDKWVY
ncbi:hypothetical protein YK48G_18920 [Lentilactobacillus fungorum]|uniref:Uncharacterized protein n=1 Tax=Lentilactobacillus fungorum TaxID=2201250 RepID=A0ABQ3VZY1_9LACO|nr:hypothetical protein [Lentilactobacillus fungorum]GHP14467.1 hypothetical protein YK48G_18920 [Lentilactobacillus fungorum]